MRTVCQDCSKRSKCTELCKEFENYVNQDHVAQQELIPSIELLDLDYDSCFDGEDLSKLPPSALKRLILALHKDGMSDHEIAYHLPCSRQYISKIISVATKNQYN